MTSRNEKGSAVILVDVADSCESVNKCWFQRFSRVGLVLMQGLWHASFEGDSCDERRADPIRSKCLSHQLLDEWASLDDAWVLLNKPFEASTLVDAAVDVLAAWCLLGDTSLPLALSLFENAFAHRLDLVSGDGVFDDAVAPLK
jgi:hypothetical protein